MNILSNAFQKYITKNDISNTWGITCTTTGYQEVPPNALYPLQQHPINYIFKKENGRILNEYQLVYITKGKGTFINDAAQKVEINAGSVILLSPGEWHSYYPDPTTGWKEYWVGFTGENMDQIVRSGYFNKEEPVFNIGINTKLIDCFEDINRVASFEQSGFQQYLSGIIQHMIGLIYFISKNAEYENNPIVEKINQARHLMNKNIGANYSPVEVAHDLGLGYTWFRRTFKKYVGISPRQYQLQLKHMRSKELLSDNTLSVSEISFELGFENLSQFSTFFKKNEGMSASEFRRKLIGG
ncbi:MAG: AraC family transcriptional regulator [Bacteroidales bacterium]